MNKDPYEVLGISRNASAAEVKAAYYELAKKYHPDNYQDSPLKEMAEEKMQEVNAAYDRIRRGDTGPSAGSYGGASGATQGGAWGGFNPFGSQQGGWNPFGGQGGQDPFGGNGNPYRSKQNDPWRRNQQNMNNNFYGYNGRGRGGGSCCDSLCWLCMADSCCECMGGDLCTCC